MSHFRFDPCVHCCGGCPTCKDRYTPTYLQLDISGIDNGDGDNPCTNCGELNGTWILPVTTMLSDHCIWYSTIDTSGHYGEWTCNNDPWERITSVWVLIDKTDSDNQIQGIPNGHYVISVWMYCDFDWPHDGPWITYQLDLGTDAPDCMHFDGSVEIPCIDWYGNPATYPDGAFHALECDPSSSNATLTTHLIPAP